MPLRIVSALLGECLYEGLFRATLMMLKRFSMTAMRFLCDMPSSIWSTTSDRISMFSERGCARRLQSTPVFSKSFVSKRSGLLVSSRIIYCATRNSLILLWIKSTAVCEASLIGASDWIIITCSVVMYSDLAFFCGDLVSKLSSSTCWIISRVIRDSLDC